LSITRLSLFAAMALVTVAAYIVATFLPVPLASAPQCAAPHAIPRAAGEILLAGAPFRD